MVGKATESMTRRFEYRDTKTSKFWEIRVEGNGFTVCQGKIGSGGQTQVEEFADATTAEMHALRLIAEKVDQNYQEVSSQMDTPDSAPATPDADEKKAAEKSIMGSTKGSKSFLPRKPVAIAKDQDSPAQALEPLVGSSTAIDRLLAKHPKSSAALLETLSHSSDRATRKAVCQNPNTSKQVLVSLARQFPGDFFQNPAFDWLLLEDPNLLFGIGNGVLKNILKRPDCPESFLTWAARHGNIEQQLAVAMNPHAPVKSLREMRDSSYPGVAAAARMHVMLGRKRAHGAINPEEEFLAGVAEELAMLGRFDAKELLDKGYLSKHHVAALAWETQLSIHDFDRIMVPEKIARRPDCPASLLELFVKIHDDDLRIAVAQHANYPVSKRVELLAALSRKSDPDIRRAVASDDLCPEIVLRALAGDKNAGVRVNVACNKNCPESVRESFRSDTNPAVRWASGSKAEDLAAWMDAAKSKNVHLLQLVAADPSCPVEVLTFLARKDEEEVMLALAENPACPAHVLVNLPWNLRSAVKNNHHCPVTLPVTDIEGQQQDLYKELAARSSACPTAMLVDIAKKGDPYTQLLVAQNDNCPRELREWILKRLLKIKSAITRYHLAESTLCSQEFRLQTFAELQSSKSAVVRSALAESNACPQSVIMALSEDKDRRVRHMALARNWSFLEELAKDGDGRDRKGASPYEWDFAAEFIRNKEAGANWLRKETSLTPWVEQCRKGLEANDLLCLTEQLSLHGIKHKNAFVRALAITQSDVSVDVLFKNQKHINWLVRAAVARNKNCPEAVLNTLEMDSNQVVVALAKANKARAVGSVKTAFAGIDELRKRAPELDELLDAIAQSLKTHTPNTGIGPALQLWLKDAGKQYLLKQTVYSQRAVLAAHPDCPVEFLMTLSRDEDAGVRGAVASSQKCPVALFSVLAKDDQGVVRAGVAKNPKCPEELLAAFAKDVDSEVRFALANNPECPEALLADFARTIQYNDHSYLVRKNVEWNKSCSVRLLEALAKNEDEDVRGAVARHPNCPVPLLETMAHDQVGRVRSNVAFNPNCPVPLLAALVKGNDWGVRSSVASNPNCPVPLLAALVKDKQWSVRSSVASNPNCSAPLFEVLTKDGNEYVRTNLASNHNYPLPLLVVLAEDKYVEVRKGVAGRLDCPVPVLVALAKDMVPKVRGYVASNTSCPKSLLVTLSKDEDPKVRRAARYNTNYSKKSTAGRATVGIPDALSETFTTAEDSPINASVDSTAAYSIDQAGKIMQETQRAIQAIYAAPSPLSLDDCVYPGCPPTLKLLAALQPDCPQEGLFKAANSTDPLERLAAVLNPMLPTAQVTRLLSDPDLNVQRAAARHANCPQTCPV